MAITLRVHNKADVQQGRLNQVFEPGAVKDFEVDNLFEVDVLVQAPDLDVEIIGADDPDEIPEEYREYVAEGVYHDGG